MINNFFIFATLENYLYSLMVLIPFTIIVIAIIVRLKRQKIFDENMYHTEKAKQESN